MRQKLAVLSVLNKGISVTCLKPKYIPLRAKLTYMAYVKCKKKRSEANVHQIHMNKTFLRI